MQPTINLSTTSSISSISTKQLEELSSKAACGVLTAEEQQTIVALIGTRVISNYFECPADLAMNLEEEDSIDENDVSYVCKRNIHDLRFGDDDTLSSYLLIRICGNSMEGVDGSDNPAAWIVDNTDEVNAMNVEFNEIIECCGDC